MWLLFGQSTDEPYKQYKKLKCENIFKDPKAAIEIANDIIKVANDYLAGNVYLLDAIDAPATWEWIDGAQHPPHPLNK